MFERIKTEKLINTRDLGGIISVDGRKIREKKLIRSGMLSQGSINDINLLINGYNVGTVIDLRTDAEVYHAPDPVLDISEYIGLSLLDDSFLGIARDEYSIDAWLNIFINSDLDPAEVFNNMYQKLVFDDHVREYYKKIFNILINSDKAVLWHCSAGKDRVGVTTALILSALNVPREYIIKDYLKTQLYTFPETLKVMILGSFKYHNKKVIESISVLMGVRSEYLENIFNRIDREYDDIFDFLDKRYGINIEMVKKLQDKYLI